MANAPSLFSTMWTSTTISQMTKIQLIEKEEEEYVLESYHGTNTNHSWQRTTHFQSEGLIWGDLVGIPNQIHFLEEPTCDFRTNGEKS